MEFARVLYVLTHRAILRKTVVDFRKGPYRCKWSFSLLLLDNFAVAQLVNVNHRSTTHPPWELLLSSGRPLRCHVLLALAAAPERLATIKVSADDPESAVSVQCKIVGLQDNLKLRKRHLLGGHLQ